MQPLFGNALGPNLLQLVGFRPDLVCISHGATGCALEWMEACLHRRIPYISISQANAEWFWPNDDRASRLAEAHRGALATCFVSKGNLDLFERQIAQRLPNARVVWNPYQLAGGRTLAWPSTADGFRLACVGRLSFQKGQDLLFQVLSDPAWRQRGIRVSLFGRGPSEKGFLGLAKMLGVADLVRFEGHVQGVEQVWATHHALILPSRCEGLSLAVVEAMLSGRMGIVTDVGGNREVIDDGRTGFVARAATAEALADALERAWTRREEWEGIGQAARTSLMASIPADPEGEFAEFLLEASGGRDLGISAGGGR